MQGIDVDDESDEAEACCVCLDSLSAAPVTMLLKSSNLRPGVRSCSHYIHYNCARAITPQKCPLCRTKFASLAQPIERSLLRKKSPSFLLCRLRDLSQDCTPPGGSSSSSARAPTRIASDLLSALLPVSGEALQRVVREKGFEECPGVIADRGFGLLLRSFDIAAATGAGTPDAVTRSTSSGVLDLAGQVQVSCWKRMLRRGRWLTLKCAGALGASLFCSACGGGLGVVVGSFLAVPSDQAPELNDDDRLVTAIKIAWLCCLAIYHGARRRDLIWNGACFGSCIGLAVGWFHGLAVVNPDRHGLRSVFMSGLTGEATLHASARHLDLESRGGGGSSSRNQPAVDVFAPGPLTSTKGSGAKLQTHPLLPPHDVV